MRKYVKIPTNLFELESIRSLDDELKLLYIELLCESYLEDGKGSIKLCNLDMTDDTIGVILNYHYNDIGSKIQVLESRGLVQRTEKSIKVFKAWASKRNRESHEYKEWRKAVMSRDGFVCQRCGAKKNLQAHHIKSWMSSEELRYCVSNGITLCRACHLIAHGGSWRHG